MSIAILSTLEQVDFTTEQARAITKIFEQDHQHLAKKEDIKYLEKDIRPIRGDIKSMQDGIKSIESRMATKDDLKAMATKEDLMSTKVEIAKTKYDLIKWIVGGIILNGFFQMLFKYLNL